jgi:hypothetical protein
VPDNLTKRIHGGSPVLAVGIPDALGPVAVGDAIHGTRPIIQRVYLVDAIDREECNFEVQPAAAYRSYSEVARDVSMVEAHSLPLMHLADLYQVT